MKPSVSGWNFTPSSTGCGSFSLGLVGTVRLLHSEHGHTCGAAVTVMAAPGASRFALSSAARARIVTGPSTAGVKV